MTRLQGTRAPCSAPAAAGSGRPGSRGRRTSASRKLSFHRTNWHDAVGEECEAVRERVGILDLGGFTKLMVEGEGAAAWLDQLICGKLPKLGRIDAVLLP